MLLYLFTWCLIACMDSIKSTQIIAMAGGVSAFALLIGLDTSQKGIQQRVQNWKSRGIPPRVVLEHLSVIRRLEKNQLARMKTNGPQTQ